MRQDPNLRLIETLATARTYRFHSTYPLGGWALCTVNDATGELLIVSDWGNWSNLWDPRYLGTPSLTHFIANRSNYDYLANKLLGRSGCWVLDADATIAKWRTKLAETRLREGRDGTDARTHRSSSKDRLDEYDAREIWHRLGSLVDDEQNESIFIEHALQIEGFARWVSNEPWEETAHRYSHEYRVLVEAILPALAAACRASIAFDATVLVAQEPAS